jgi:hypothetical protein
VAVHTQGLGRGAKGKQDTRWQGNQKGGNGVVAGASRASTKVGRHCPQAAAADSAGPRHEL